MPLQGSLSIERMCQLVPVSRRGFYRSLQEQQPVVKEMEVRSTLQQIAVEHRQLSPSAKNSLLPVSAHPAAEPLRALHSS